VKGNKYAASGDSCCNGACCWCDDTVRTRRRRAVQYKANAEELARLRYNNNEARSHVAVVLFLLLRVGGSRCRAGVFAFLLVVVLAVLGRQHFLDFGRLLTQIGDGSADRAWLESWR